MTYYKYLILNLSIQENQKLKFINLSFTFWTGPSC